MANNQQNNNVPTGENSTPKLAQIELTEAVKFNNIIDTATVTSSELEKTIAELFGSTFVDFEGCKIMPVQQQGQPQPETLKCKLYFKPATVKGDGLYAVKVRGEDSVNKGKSKVTDLSVLVNTINMYSKSKQFELEDMAKELLSEFLIIPDAKTVYRYNEELGKEVLVRLPKNWNAFTEEISDTTVNPRFQNPYLAVTLDLLPLVAKLYGKKDPKEVKTLAARGIIPKDRYQYSVSIVKVLNAMTRSYILEIKRIDTKALNDLANSIGYGSVSGGSILMTRR